MTFKQSSDLRLALSETRKIGTNCLTQEKSWLFAPSSNRDRAIKRIIAKLNQDKVRVSYEIRYLYLNRWQLRLYFRSKRSHREANELLKRFWAYKKYGIILTFFNGE